MKLLIAGGVARRDNKIRSDWNSFEQGILIVYDTVSCEVEHEFRYTTPLENKPSDDSSVLFKACDIFAGHIYLTTKTEVLKYDPTSKEVIKVLSHPLMNDVHHAAVLNNKLYVVSTGIDSLLVFDTDMNELLDTQYLLKGESPIDSMTDYRKIESLKPHKVHPNYVFVHNDDVFVTRFQQKDCLRIRDNYSVSIADNFIHDGVPINDKYYFTSVDGKVIVTDLENLHKTFDLNDEIPADEHLGWCRGILPLTEDRVMVGFSVLRTTKFKENVKWLYSKLNSSIRLSSKRSRISTYELSNLSVIDEIYIDDLGIDAVFSIKHLDIQIG